MYSQCMKSDGKSTGLWVSTLALVAKPVSHRMRLDYLPSLAFLDAVMDVKKTACWLCESLAGINPYLVLAAFLPHCASSKPCWVLMPKLILRGCFFCIFYEKSGNKQCFWPQTHFAALFWRAVWVKSVKCKTLFAKLLEIWDKHFHPANLNHRCPWKIQRLSRAGLSHALFAQETSFCGRSSTGEALHQGCTFRTSKEFEDVFCFMERTRKSVLWHPTIPPWEQTPRLLGLSAHCGIEFCEHCCDVEQKSLKQADTLVWSISCGAEFSRMQKDNSGICSLLQLALQNAPLWASLACSQWLLKAGSGS